MGAVLREGALVRTVIEGRVTFHLEDEGRSNVTIEYLDVDGDAQKATYIPVDKVEVLPEPLKVGDMVEGHEAYVGLPPGAIVKAIEGFDGYDEVVFVRTDTGFVNAAGTHFGEHLLTEARPLVYLPEVG